MLAALLTHILLYDSELMATLTVNFLQTISTSTRQVVLWISSFAWKCNLSWKIFSQSTLDFLGIFMESECHLSFRQNFMELCQKKKVLLLDPMGTDVLRQTVITKFYALSPIFENFRLFLSVVLELSF